MFSVCNNKNEKDVFTRFLPEFEHKENLMNKAAASKYVSRFLEFLLFRLHTIYFLFGNSFFPLIYSGVRKKLTKFCIP